MKYRVLQPFKSVMPEGTRELLPGTIITLPHDTAMRLLTKGKITPVEKVAYKVYSNILQAYLWVVADDKDRETLRASQSASAIYTADEIKKLKGLSKDSLIEIHKVKETFPESTIKEIKRNAE